MNKSENKLLIRSLDEELSATEAEQLNRLMETDPDARQEMDTYRLIREHIATDGPGSFSPFFSDRVVRDLRRSVSFSRLSLLPNNWYSLLLSTRSYAWVAAMIIILVGVTLLFQSPIRFVEVPFGRTMDVSLSDGSTVSLSSGSTIAYRKQWGSEPRQVELNGEAYFTVVSAEAPFIVETFNARIFVTGTEFNVRAWQEMESDETTVTVATGRVEVHARPESAQIVRAGSVDYVVLEPGQASTVPADTTAPRQAVNVSLDQILAWRTGGFVFTDRPLTSVFNELERRFDIEIVFAGNDIGELSLVYLNPGPASAESVLSDICHTLDLQYLRTANGFEVVRR